MGISNESFYTTDFDQKMMDFIESRFKIENPNNNRKEETFTKKDLVDGMFVKTRNGEINIVIGDIVCDNTGFLDIEQEYDVYLVASGDFEELDIMEVLVKDSNQPLHKYLSGEGLKSVWKRTPPKSEKVIRLEKLITMHEEQLEATKKLLAEELDNV